MNEYEEFCRAMRAANEAFEEAFSIFSNGISQFAQAMKAFMDEMNMQKSMEDLLALLEETGDKDPCRPLYMKTSDQIAFIFVSAKKRTKILSFLERGPPHVQNIA